MKSKLPVVVISIFVAYLAFVAVIMVSYDPSPDEMDWEDRQAYNKAMLNEVAIGQSITEIKSLFGKADFTEAKISNEQNIEVLFYRTHHRTSDGETSKEECTPLLFKQGKLIAWGEDTYHQYLASPIDS
ncbi:conserved hypothetical protein [Shewanella halifaxensis HAW-EB4]|uniref:DUF3192 domain-containing protein n=1 Tax=Shewanella halifaxensis (strain HAW-EB4) TaxID=458817 RepID=B0TPG8_SHEHH|nr:DUF3192 domain-containing protein [Shewanella halifaxensis]ABZ77615.1 conserved hypothetical protein [Shewanella halifaxensis HAW-EB4]